MEMLAENITSKESRMRAMEMMQNSSHRLGACLLTGQQASVDITSNYATSMILFSSVNVIFMVTVVVWISASFALFHIGGFIKTDAEMNGDINTNSNGDQLPPNGGCACGAFSLDDFLMFVAIVWNAVLAFLLLSQDFRMYQNIPLNNAILAIAALLVSIFVQWGWANAHTFDVELQEVTSRKAMISGQRESEKQPVKIMVDSNGNGPQGEKSDGASMMLSLDTSNFMATANAVREYGLEYTRSAALNNRAGSAGNSQTLRKRTMSSYSANEKSFGEQSFYTVPFGQNKNRKAVMMTSMPSYTALVRTGTPFAHYNYINLIKV